MRDKTFGEYDVVVDDTPTSPNQKEANWAIIQPLLAIFKDQLMQNPKVFAEMLENSPLPSRLVEMIKKFVNEADTDPAKAQEVATAKQLLQVQGGTSTAGRRAATATTIPRGMGASAPRYRAGASIRRGQRRSG